MRNERDFRLNGSRLRDDWFIFHFDHNHNHCIPYADCEPTKTEIHELCSHDSCLYDISEPCEFHPVGCECSLGSCQENA